MDPIDKIMEKLETAANLRKPGALTDDEFGQLKTFVRAAVYLAEENRICAEKLTRAVCAVEFAGMSGDRARPGYTG